MRIFTRLPFWYNRIPMSALILLLALFGFSNLQAQDCDPPAFAGENDTICGLSHTLYGNYQGGNWSLLCDSLDGLVDMQLLLDDAMQVTVSNSGDYEFIYTYEDASCFSSDTVELQFCAPHSSGMTGSVSTAFIVEGECPPSECILGASNYTFPNMVEAPTATEVSIAATDLACFYDYTYSEVTNIQADTCLADINVFTASNTQFISDETWVVDIDDFFEFSLPECSLPGDYFDDLCEEVCGEEEITEYDIDFYYLAWWDYEIIDNPLGIGEDSLFITFTPDSINFNQIEVWELTPEGDIVESFGGFNIFVVDSVVVNTSTTTTIEEVCQIPCLSFSTVGIPIPPDPNYDCSFQISFLPPPPPPDCIPFACGNGEVCAPNGLEWFIDGSPLSFYSNGSCDIEEITAEAFIYCPATESFIETGFIHTATIYPEPFLLNSFDGGCGFPASIEVLSANGNVCDSVVGDAPGNPPCDSGLFECADVDFATVYFPGSPCEQEFAQIAIACCDSVPCGDCPSTTDASTTEDIASGNTPNLPTISLNNDNGNEVEWFDGAGGSGIPSIAIDYSNSDCDPVAIILNAFILCDHDENPATPDVYVDLAVSHTVTIFPNLDEIGDISIINDGSCGPSIDFPCDGSPAYVVTNTYDGNGANPDFSSETTSGSFNFTISNLDSPFGGSLSITAIYDCNSCPSVLTPASGTFSFCGIDSNMDLASIEASIVINAAIAPVENDGIEFYLTPQATDAYVPGNLINYISVSCDPIITTVYAYYICDLYGDNSFIDYIAAGSFDIEVYPDLSDLNIVVIDDGTCNPYVDSYDCEGTANFSITNDYDNNGGNPDLSGETTSGDVNFSVTNFAAPATCSDFTISAEYVCTDTPTPCPSTTDTSTSEDICSGETPTLPNINVVDDNGNPIEWFINVPEGTPFTGHNFENEDCKAEIIEVNAFILCDQDNDASTPDVYVDLNYTHTVNVYPIIEATAFADDCNVYLESPDCNNFIVTWTITTGDNEGATGNGNTYTPVDGETGEITYTIENEDAISTNVNCAFNSSSVNFNCPADIEEPEDPTEEEPIIEEPIAENKFAIPNAFTPNGDGINDLFRVTGNSIATYELLVYNRWGQLLYNSTNQGWDGSKKGEFMNLGVYVYEAFIQYEDGEKDYARGNVSLIR